jgi:hypothetical protein
MPENKISYEFLDGNRIIASYREKRSYDPTPYRHSTAECAYETRLMLFAAGMSTNVRIETYELRPNAFYSSIYIDNDDDFAIAKLILS